jgi:4-hydroxybenzoate polyprenyltransferase
MSVYTLLRYHAYSIWLFTWSDLKTIVLPKTVFGTLNALAFPVFEIDSIPQPTTSDILWRIPLTAFWVWIILLPFVIDNQRLALSIEEDKVNKPWRAIASGRLDKSYAKVIMLWLYVATISISWYIGGLPHACLGILLGTHTTSPLLREVVNEL